MPTLEHLIPFFITVAIVNLSFSNAEVIVVLIADRVPRMVKSSRAGAGVVNWLSGLTPMGLRARLAPAGK
jgi:hypothetical protein